MVFFNLKRILSLSLNYVTLTIWKSLGQFFGTWSPSLGLSEASSIRLSLCISGWKSQQSRCALICRIRRPEAPVFPDVGGVGSGDLVARRGVCQFLRAPFPSGNTSRFPLRLSRCASQYWGLRMSALKHVPVSIIC